MYGLRTVNPLIDLTSDRPLVERLRPKAPSGRSAPPDAELLMTEMAALAGLLAHVVELAPKAAIFPGHLETIAEQATEHESVRAALLTAQKDKTVSRPDSAEIGGVEPCPSCNAAAGVQQDFGTAPNVQAWSCELARPPRREPHRENAVGATRRDGGVAKQAPALTDEQLPSRLAATGVGGAGQYLLRGAAMSSSPDLAAAKRLLDAAKDQGFRFERIAPGPDGPLRGVRETLEFIDELYLAGFWEADACTAIRRRRCALLVPGGLPVTARIEGDALTVLHTVVTDWACW